LAVFWLRRQRDQDVTTDAPKTAKAAPKTPATAIPGSTE